MNKKFFLIIFIPIIFLIILVLNKTEKATPIPRSLPTPTLFPITSTSEFKEPFKITNILPLEDQNEEYFPFQFITVFFNYPVEKDKFFYYVYPFVETKISSDITKKNIIIAPKKSWIKGTTTVSILENTLSLDGRRLSKKYIYKIKTGLPSIGE